MPYADNRGVRIHYQVEGVGPPLVLHHGFTWSIEDWYEWGYVDALKGDYRLILVDGRGHGASDKPHEPEAYLLENRVGDVVAVLDALAIQKAHFWGYSMGGWIGFGMAEFAPERLDHLVVGGQHPYARSQEGFRQLFRIGIADGHGAFVVALEKMLGETLPPGYRTRLHESDLKAFLAAAEDRTSHESVLPKMAMPCCLYAGEADPLFAGTKQASELIPRANFFPLTDLSHADAVVRADLVLPQVTAFLQRGA